MSSRWPSTLWIVRHGQSAGNVARDLAQERAYPRIELDGRDVDVPLSPLGQMQATALGQWFAKAAPDQRPQALLCSPYRRAVQTAELFRAAGGCPPEEPICLDERLREKEFGILDGLTSLGVAQLQPEQAQFRSLLGKFYHRPPGGESWTDVILRLRNLLDTICLHYNGQRVMIVAHQVVVLCMRYILEKMTEAEILAIDQTGDVANCSVTEFRIDPDSRHGGSMVLERYNAIAPIAFEQVPVTSEPDRIAGARG